MIDYVVSLELAKKLEDVGILIDSEYYWEVDLDSKLLVSRNAKSLKRVNEASGDRRMYYQAPLAVELGDLLPGGLDVNGVRTLLLIQKIQVGNKSTFPDFGKWGVVYASVPNLVGQVPPVLENNLANAFAEMLINLKERKLL